MFERATAAGAGADPGIAGYRVGHARRDRLPGSRRRNGRHPRTLKGQRRLEPMSATDETHTERLLVLAGVGVAVYTAQFHFPAGPLALLPVTASGDGSVVAARSRHWPISRSDKVTLAVRVAALVCAIQAMGPPGAPWALPFALLVGFALAAAIRALRKATATDDSRPLETRHPEALLADPGPTRPVSHCHADPRPVIHEGASSIREACRQRQGARAPRKTSRAGEAHRPSATGRTSGPGHTNWLTSVTRTQDGSASSPGRAAVSGGTATASAGTAG